MRYLSVALLFMASTAVAQDWQQIASLDSNGGVLFVDASDIMEVNGYRRAWFRWDHATDQPIPSEHAMSVPKAKTYRWVQTANLFHCAEQIIAVAEQRWFDTRDRDLGGHRPDALQFAKVSPGSIEQQMLEAVCRPESVESLERIEQRADVRATMVTPASPDDHYPRESRRRREAGSPVVQVCVGRNGRLLRAPMVAESSGFPALDAAAIEVAKASRYAPGEIDGVAVPESCIEYKVKFGGQP